VLEILIAGAGPAGSVAALVLARAGARVLLLDRARFPRDKLCGDTVNPGAMAILERLGLGARVEQRGLRLDGMLVTGEGGVHVEGRYGPGVHGRSLVRRDLDAWLLSQAIDAGARFEEGVQVLEPLIYESDSGAEVRGAVVRGRDGRRLRIPALVTIAADGRRSTLAFARGLASHPERPRRWAAGTYYQDVDGLSALGEMHVRPGRYIGVAPMPGGLANVCVVTADRRGFDDPSRLVAEAVAADPILRDRFARAKPASLAVSLGPLAVDARAAGARGLLLAGDAAGFIDPMTGDGIRLALRGAELAARVVLESVEHDLGSAHVRLTAARDAEFTRKLRFNRALRALVGRAAAVRAAAIGAYLAPFLLRRVIAVAGDAGATPA
jgi:flavin-dependent dehydrogenase